MILHINPRAVSRKPIRLDTDAKRKTSSVSLSNSKGRREKKKMREKISKITNLRTNIDRCRVDEK